MSVRAVLERLKTGTERVSTGRFRVDSAKALAKMRDFRLVDPHHYCLELLRAAVASRASQVDVRVDADELEMAFDGLPVPAESLRELFGAAFSGGSDLDTVRLRLLALGVIGALGLRPRWVDVESGGLRVRVTPPDRIETVPGGRGEATRVHVMKSRSFRVLRNAIVGPPEVGLIRERTPCFPASLRINGESVKAEAFPEGAVLAEREHSAGPLRLMARIPRPAGSPAGLASTAIAVHGVVVVHREIEAGVLSLLVLANDDRLRRNASGSDVVDNDPAFKAMVEAIVALGEELAGDLLKSLAETDAADARRVLTAAAAKGAVTSGGNGALSPRLRDLLLRAPLLPDPSGGHFSVQDLIDATKPRRPLRVAHESYTRDLYDPPVLLLPLSTDQAALIPAVPRRDIAGDVKARLTRQRYRALFEAQPREEPKLGARGDLVAAGSIEAKTVEGEVGLPRDAEASEVRFLLQHRFVEQAEVPELAPLRVRAVVDSEQLTPDDRFRTVRRDRGRDAAIEAIRDSAIAALVAALGSGGSPGEALTRHAHDAILTRLEKKRPIPDRLRSAPLCELAGGGWISVEDLDRRATVRYVSTLWPYPALDREPVVILPETELPLWQRHFGRKKLHDFSEALRREVATRDRMEGPKEEARITEPVLARLPVTGEGFHGEIGIPDKAGAPRIEAKLLRDGFRLEERTLETAGGRMLATIECAELTPSRRWDKAERDDAYDRVIAAIQAAFPLLIPAVLDRFSAQTLDGMPPSARAYLLGCLQGLGSARKELHEALLEAPLIATAHGPLSLTELRRRLAGSKTLWVLPPGRLPEIPPEMTVVVASEETAAAIEKVLGLPREAPSTELELMRRRRDFERLPQRSATLPASVTPKVPIDEPGVQGEIGAATREETGIRLQVLYQRRPLTTLDLKSRLTLEAVVDVEDPSVDPTAGALPPHVEKRIARVLASAEERLVQAALDAPDSPPATHLLLEAIGARYDDRVPALNSIPLFTTTTGDQVSLHDLSRRLRIFYVTEPVSGSHHSGAPVVLATDSIVRAALARWGGRRRNVARELAEQVAARTERQQMRPAAEIRVTGTVLRRRSLTSESLIGEVALVEDGEARLDLYHRRRLIERITLSAPEGVAAAVNCDLLKPKVRLDGVKRDRQYQRVVASVLRELAALGAEVAGQWPQMTEPERSLLKPAVSRLAAWCRQNQDHQHPLLSIPVLESTERHPLSIADLAREQAAHGRVLFSERPGSLMDRSRRVWMPRPGERSLLKGFHLVDATEAIIRADGLRASPPLPVEAPAGGRFRERVLAPGLEGEVALDPRRGTLLTLELLKERRLLETIENPYPIGVVARVNHDGLRADELWSRAERDAAYQAVRNAVDAAIERALVRALRDGKRSDWQPFVRGAIRSRLGGGGPVAEALLALPLFRDVEGGEVSTGRVLAESSERGQVAILEMGVSAPPSTPGLVLSVNPEALELLALLSVRTEDLGPAAQEAAERAKRIEARRIRKRQYEKDALARLPVHEGGWSGELALPHPPDPAESIVMARAGIAAGLHREGNLGVAGVLDHADLPVDGEGWAAPLDPATRDRIGRWVSSLLAKAALEAPRQGPAQREMAAFYILRHLARLGISAPAHLDRLEDQAAALARSSLFQSAGGRSRDLRSIADHVLRHGPVAVIGEALPDESSEGTLVLRTTTLESPWTTELERVLGPGSVRRFESAATLAMERSEQDPPPEDSLAAGLALLRQEAELLRADASGRLSATELREIRLRRGGGRWAVSYDAARGVALVDPEHPAVARGLAEAKESPGLLFVLLAAVYGAVNRALERVTDEDEERLVGSLLAHLAANPNHR